MNVELRRKFNKEGFDKAKHIENQNGFDQPQFERLFHQMHKRTLCIRFLSNYQTY